MALCRSVKALTDKMDGFCKQGAAQTQFSGHTPSLDHNTSTGHMVEEMREIHDREHRKDYIILREVHNLEASEGQLKYYEISQHLFNKEITLQNMVCLNRERCFQKQNC